MSRIYFHSPSGDGEVRGSERAYAAHLCQEMFITALGVSGWDTPSHPHVLRRIIAPSHYCLQQSGLQFEQQLRTALVVSGFGPVLNVDGQDIDVFSTTLNTALVMGSNPIKLSARLHGQCEIHAWVDGLNREWLAGIIEQGRKVGIFRGDSGWESVVALLKSRNDEPVVTSYSVCEQFPNAHAATSPFLEMKPDNWDSYYFNDGLTGFDLLAKAVELDKDKAA
jgi:hypothetical protein